MAKIRDEQKGLIFIGMMLLIIIAVSVIFSYSLKTDIVQETLKTEKNIKMLIGVEDSDESLLFSSVIIYYPSSQKAALINLPGYTGSIYESLNRADELKSVYKEKGMESYRDEVKKLLGINIPFYAVISMNNFIKLCDYLGGFRVFISEPIDFTSEDGQRYMLPSGSVSLDGDKIYSYLHYKLPDETEVDLQDRYQNVMAAFITALSDRKFSIFNNENSVYYEEIIKTNLTKKEETQLLKIVSDVDAESIIKQTITGSFRSVDGKRLLFPLNNGENIRNNVRQVTNMLVSADGGYSSRVYVLEIQNGTIIQGLARNTSILFQNASYDVLSAVNADRNDYEETIIIDRIGNEEAAKSIGEFIHCDNIVEEKLDEEEDSSSTKMANVDFTIILGKDFNGQYVVKRRTSN